jgi:hypothetical protein
LRPKKFFAIGQVIEPRKRERHRKQPVHADTTKRTTEEHYHRFFDGIVCYAPETNVFYEDFTDDWFVQVGKEKWQYAQRIDVREWEDIRQSGVSLPGLRDAARSCGSLTRVSLFQINKPFFEKIKKLLKKGKC